MIQTPTYGACSTKLMWVSGLYDHVKGRCNCDEITGELGELPKEDSYSMV